MRFTLVGLLLAAASAVLAAAAPAPNNVTIQRADDYVDKGLAEGLGTISGYI